MFNLSNRLKIISSYVPNDLHVADIGGDHAFLLIQLAREGRLKHGIIGEVNRGPYENACRNVTMMGYQKLIDVRLGNGFSVFKSDEVDFIVIAGMGGALITSILEQGKEKLKNIKGMVLQPNLGTKNVRSWLKNHYWQLTKETIVEEDEHMYEILVTQPGNNGSLYQDSELSMECLLEIGPLLWRQRHPLLLKRIEKELIRKELMINQLEKGSSEFAKRKWNLEKQKVSELKRVIKCLSLAMN